MKIRNAFTLAVATQILSQGCGWIKKDGEPLVSEIDATKMSWELADAACRPLLKEDKNLGLMKNYQSCGELEEDLNSLSNYSACVKARARMRAFPVSASATQDDSASAPVDVLTNVREAGVDEPDFVKISGEQIFVVSLGRIQVLNRSDKKILGSVKISAEEAQLLIKDNLLIVVGARFIGVYSISPEQLPALRYEKTYEEQITDARLAGDHLILTMRGHFRFAQSEGLQLKESQNSKIMASNCTQMIRPHSPRILDSGALTRLESLSLSDPSQVWSQTFPGNGNLYMTPKSVYFYQHLGVYGQREETVIGKFPINSKGEFAALVAGRVKGRIKDVWALSERPGGELAVATSSGDLASGTGKNSAKNHFTILAQKGLTLAKIGETEDFGLKEDIRSVRFVENIAYVVTFKKTDPLFAIDISNSSTPRILGELKVPGFSTYMHPMSSTQLVGLGFDAADQGNFAYYQGLQLSLFNTSRPSALSRTDVKILGVRGTSSAATSDHKAFYLDPKNQVVGFPLNEINQCQDTHACKQLSPGLLSPVDGSNSSFSGAVLYRIKDDKFAYEQRISHRDLMSENCLTRSNPIAGWWQSSQKGPDIERIFKLGEELLSVSQGGLKSFRWADKLEVVASARWNSSCDSELPPRIINTVVLGD